jgi:hypothetical protein
MIAESGLLPAAIDMVQTVFSEKCSQQLHNALLSNITGFRWIANISEDLEEQLIEMVRNIFQYRLTKQLIAVVLVT